MSVLPTPKRIPSGTTVVRFYDCECGREVQLTVDVTGTIVCECGRLMVRIDAVWQDGLTPSA